MQSLIPTIVIDTREKEPYSFSFPSVRKKIDAGDYSIQGFEDKVSLERKSLIDLVNTVIWSRERFFSELRKLSQIEFCGIVIEGSLRDIIERKYKTKAHPNAITGTLLSIIIDFKIPFYFCTDRQASCYFTERYLQRIYWRLMNVN